MALVEGLKMANVKLMELKNVYGAWLFPKFKIEGYR